MQNALVNDPSLLGYHASLPSEQQFPFPRQAEGHKFAFNEQESQRWCPFCDGELELRPQVRWDESIDNYVRTGRQEAVCTQCGHRPSDDYYDLERNIEFVRRDEEDDEEEDYEPELGETHHWS